MTIRALSLVSIICMRILVVSTAFAVEYFPSEPGPTFTYEDGVVSIVPGWTGGFSRTMCYECDEGYSNTFIVDPDGDIYITVSDQWAEAQPCPSFQDYEPDLLYLDFPLTTSKTWSSTGTQWGVYGEDQGRIALTGEVLGPDQVTVPAGVFQVIVVSLKYQHLDYPWTSRTEVLWLHRQIGPVGGLVSWTGVVENRTETWGAIKAVFR